YWARCTVAAGHDYFDYWGQGTLVTVSSETPSPPTLFPLLSCDSTLPDETQVTLGCLARDFLPSSITFSWNFKNTSSVSSQNIHTFPEVMRDGKYMASSQVLLPSTDTLQSTDEFLMCNAKHSSGNQKVKVPISVVAELPPNVSVFIPPRDSFSGNSPRKSQVICQASGFSPKRIDMSWLREGKPVPPNLVSTSAVEVEPRNQGSATFRVISRLTITESDWLSQTVFTCQAVHRGLTFQKNTSSSCSSTSSSSGIGVFPIAPSFEGIFLTHSAQLTCLVTGLATYDSLRVTWSRQNGETLTTHTNISESHPNATFSATGQASVCQEDWESGEKFTCTVEHDDLPMPVKQTLSRPKDIAKHPPSVYVLPPAQEQLKLRELVTITCLVKDFSPPDVFVQWHHRGQTVSSEDYVTSAPKSEPQTPGLYFVHSMLTVSEKDWSNGESYSCIVGHEALPLSVTEKTVDKASGKPTLYNVSLILSDTASTCY
ncbi:hypothetical protein NP202_23875, partial [Salmonella enterica]|nr:hypothetical protein [Salmonella enterica]